MYYNGTGVFKDKVKAKSLFEQAALQGRYNAQKILNEIKTE